MLAKYENDLRNSTLCEGNIESITTELRFEFESVVVIIEDVPAFRCAGRDDDLIPGPLGVVLGDLAFEIAEHAMERLKDLAVDTDEPIETRIKIPQQMRRAVPA